MEKQSVTSPANRGQTQKHMIQPAFSQRATSAAAASCAGNWKLTDTVRVLPPRSFEKCQLSTDCSTALRNSSGPLTTDASTTVPSARQAMPSGLLKAPVSVLVKLLFFPLANKSYKAMSKMKLLQPEMIKLREKYGDDKAKLNEEMMALYKREKALVKKSIFYRHPLEIDFRNSNKQVLRPNLIFAPLIQKPILTALS